MSRICENCDKVYPDDISYCECCNTKTVKLTKGIIKEYVKECIERM